jgi:hypothetical protein
LQQCRLDEIAKRLHSPTEQPTIDVTPPRQASPSPVFASRIKDVGRHE